MYKTLLWATDGSVQSDAALELALDLLDADGHLIAVHCDQRFSGSHVGGLPVLPDEDERRERISARVDELRSSGVDAALTVRTTTTHDPSVVIARLADELDAGAIVCGTRALHSVNATLGGSVAAHLLRHAHVPVFVVPPARTTAHSKGVML